MFSKGSGLAASPTGNPKTQQTHSNEHGHSRLGNFGTRGRGSQREIKFPVTGNRVIVLGHQQLG